jgi:P-type Cu+ transporter
LQANSAPQETCIVRFKVEGMVCGSCSAAVQNRLSSTSGILSATVSHANHCAEVHYKRSVLTQDEVKDVIEDCGFDATVLEEARAHSVSFYIPEISTDWGKLSDLFAADQGIVGPPSIDPEADVISVYYDANHTGPRNIQCTLVNAGLSPSLADVVTGSAAALNTNAVIARNAWQMFHASLVFTVPVVLIAKASWIYPELGSILRTQILGFPFDELAKCILTTPVQFVIGWRFHHGALKSLQRGSANMDVLVSLGTNASYLYSVISILHHHFMRHHLSGVCRTGVLPSLPVSSKYLACSISSFFLMMHRRT